MPPPALLFFSFLCPESHPSSSLLVGSSSSIIAIDRPQPIPSFRSHMKIQCDVCGAAPAAVFCCADEAALCAACDRRVHRANKLAGKHRRFSLLSPSSGDEDQGQSHPLCDVCQEKRGFLFCQEDRAILCRDCDEPIHTANQLTMKHHRFLLTGTLLSSAPVVSSSPSSPPPTQSNESSHEKPPAPAPEEKSYSSGSGSSSISEYLTKTIPGYRVEDLLVDDAIPADDFYKRCELLPFLEVDPGGGGLGEIPVWVPHVPQIPPSSLPSAVAAGAVGGSTAHYSHSGSGAKEAGGGRRWSEENSFMVPQITPASTNNKRPRPPPPSSLPWYY